MRTITRLVAIATFPVFCGAAPIASAGTDLVTDPVKVTLAHDDNDLESVALDFDRAALATPAGVSAVHRAIRQAARHVCDSYLGGRGDAAEQDCRAQAMTEAEGQLAVEIASLRSGSTLYAGK